MASLPLIYFSRHGQTDWNVEKRVQGSVERDLNEQGRSEASRNGDSLKKILGNRVEDFLFVSSPMRRTRETMELIRIAMGLDPALYETDSRLRELSFGDWEGFTEEDLVRRSAEVVAERLSNKWNFLPPGRGAESYAMLAVRMNQWLEGVSQETVCVTHGGCLRCIFRLYGRMSESEAANVCIYQGRILRLEHGKLSWV